MLNAELKILAGKYQGKAIPLSTKRFLVGREQDCQLRPNSELVSRHHCVFVTDDYAVRLRDLGSTNGTRVNGDLLRGEIVLKPGDRITIGRLEVELVVREAAVVATTAVVAAGNLAGSVTPPSDIPAIESAATVTPSESDTSFEIPTTAASAQATMTNFGGDTAIIPGATGAPMVPLAGAPQPMMPMGYPMGYGFPGQMQMPGYGYGMPQGFPMGMPGMGQGYPMGMPGMPMMPQQMPQQSMPGGKPAAGAATVAEQPVKLPDPSTTGAKPPAAPAAAAGGQASAATSVNPSQSAADIIKQFMHRRAGE